IQEAEFSPSSWTALSPDATNGAIVGAFLAYNMQWDRLVLGVDAAYNYASKLETTAGDSISRQFVTTDQFNNQISIHPQPTMKLVAYATLPARAGYAFGQFLPYGAMGVAVGRFDYATTVTVHSAGQPIPPAPGSPFDNTTTLTTGKTNAYIGGFAV